VICFEVLIHLTTSQAYYDLIRFLSEHTLQTLIVSGYDSKDNQPLTRNHMLFFHEPLETSLRVIGRFKSFGVYGLTATLLSFDATYEIGP
jgi:hypothetical protein